MFDDQVPVSRLVFRYARTGAVVLVLVAVATAYASHRVATTEAVDNANRVATLVAASAVEPLLEDGILTNDPAVLSAIDRAVRGRLLRESLVRVKVWREDGTILYSDESRLIGQRFELDDDDLQTLRTGKSQAASAISRRRRTSSRRRPPSSSRCTCRCTRVAGPRCCSRRTSAMTVSPRRAATSGCDSPR